MLSITLLQCRHRPSHSLATHRIGARDGYSTVSSVFRDASIGRITDCYGKTFQRKLWHLGSSKQPYRYKNPHVPTHILVLCMAYYSTRRASTAQSATSTRRLLVGSIATSLCTVVVDGVLAGSAFTHRWQHSEEGSSTTVCWITQLVVHKSYRGRGLASGLLGLVRSGSDGVYGIISSHPAACLAAAKSFGSMFGVTQVANPN